MVLLRILSTLSCLALLSLLLAPLAQSGAPVPADQASLFVRPQAIQRLADDPWMGGVWIGTDAGLFFKDMGTGALRHYGYLDGLPSNKVADVHVTASEVWVATLNGVSILDKGSHTMRDLELGGSRFPHATRTVFIDDRGAWIGTAAHGLFHAAPGVHTALAVGDPRTGQPFVGSVEGLGSWRAELFVSVMGDGLTIWNRDSGTASHHDKVYVGEKPLFGRVLVRPDAVWIGTQGDGVVRMDRSNGWQTSEFSSPDTTGSMSTFRPIEAHNAVYMPTLNGAARYDLASKSWRNWSTLEMGGSANEIVLSQGDLYAAMAFGEIRHLDRASGTWQLVKWWDMGRTITHNLVQSCEADGPLLAFGTLGGGANYLDPATGTWVRAGEFPWERGAPDNVAIHAMASSAQERYYGLSKGVSVVDRATGEYRHFYTDGRVGEGRGHNPVRDIAIDGEHTWIATQAVMQPKARSTSPEIWNPGGLVQFDRESGELRRYGEDSGLPHQNATRLAVDTSTVWVGLRGGGVAAFDKATRTAAPVESSMGVVNDLALDGSTLWAAAAEQGLWRVDAATRAAHAIPGWPGGAALAVHPSGTMVWVGTLLNGLHAYDTAAGTWTSYHTGRPVDMVAFCILEHDNVLYLGGGWGIERFNLVTNSFLPQMSNGAPSRGSLPASGALPPAGTGTTSPPWIAMDAIPSPWTAPSLRITGTASLPEGGHIEVRSGRDDWRSLGAMTSWSADFELPPGSQGEDDILARVVSSGQVLAQTSRHVAWHLGTAPSAIASGSTVTTSAEGLSHPVVTEAWRGVPVAFVLDDGSPRPGLGATLEIWEAGAMDARQVPFVAQADGSLVATASWSVAGPGAYRLRAAWDGGSEQLPGEFTSYGGRYPVLVRDGASAGAVLHVPVTPTTHLHAGNNTTVTLYVNNLGLSPVNATLHLTGKGAGFVREAPTSVLVPVGGSSPVVLQLAVPPGTKSANYALGVQLWADGAVLHDARVNVVVAGASARAEDAASPGLLLLVVALTLAVVRARAR